MKIGFITLKNHTRIAGTERVLVDTIETLHTKGIQTKCYLSYKPKNQQFLNEIGDYSLAYVPKFLREKHLLRPRALYKLMHKIGMKKLFNEIQDDQLDALFVLKIEDEFLKNYPNFIRLKSNNPTLKLIAWPHCDLQRTIKLVPNYAKKLGIFDAFYAISDGIADTLSQQLKLKNVFTIYNPIKEAEQVIRKTNKFLYIGRIDEDKRVSELLYTLDKLHNRNWTLDIIGTPPNKEKEQKFLKVIDSLNCRGNITYHGWQNDPWSLVNSAGILLLNSRVEGFALVLAEAMMRGIPCISTDCPSGPASIIKNGVNGWLVDLNDEQQLIDLLEAILSKQKPLPPTDKVIESVKKFNIDNVIDNFLLALKTVKTLPRNQ